MRLAVDHDHIGRVLGGVTGRVHRAHREGPDVDVLEMERRSAPVGGSGGGGQDEVGVGASGRLGSAGDVIIVEMRLEHHGEGAAVLVDGGEEPIDVTLGIDEHRHALVGEHMCRVAEAGRPDRRDVHGLSLTASCRWYCGARRSPDGELLSRRLPPAAATSPHRGGSLR